MYNKHNIKILKKRIEDYPKASPSILFYYLGMARFQIKKGEYSQSNQYYFIKLKLNKWNPLTLLYMFGVFLKSLWRGVVKGCEIYERCMADIKGTTYAVDLTK